MWELFIKLGAFHRVTILLWIGITPSLMMGVHPIAVILMWLWIGWTLLCDYAYRHQ